MLQGIETIQIARTTRTGFDEYGLPIEGGETLITVPNVLVGFDGSSEPVMVNEDPVNTDITLYLPSSVTVLPDDEFVIRGERFVKAGRSMEWQSPFSGFEAGNVVKVRQRLG